MIKVLHKRLRKINGYPARGTARQGLQLARQDETKTGLPKLKRGLQRPTALWKRCKEQRASCSWRRILGSFGLLWLWWVSISSWIHYTPREVDDEILFGHVNEHILDAEPLARGRWMH